MKNLLIAIVALMFSVAHGQGVQGKSPSAAGIQASVDERVARVLAEKEASATAKELERQIAHDNDDLAAQRKAANAAERSADLALLQTILSAVGALGLFLSLYYTRASMRHVEKSMHQAERAATLTESQIAATKKQTRPLVTVKTSYEVILAPRVKSLLAVRVTFEVLNSGATVAANICPVVFTTAIYPDDANILQQIKVQTAENALQMLGPSQTTTAERIIQRPELITLGKRESTFFVFANVSYQDMFGEQYETQACWLLDWLYDVDEVETSVNGSWERLMSQGAVCELTLMPPFSKSS